MFRSACSTLQQVYKCVKAYPSPRLSQNGSLRGLLCDSAGTGHESPDSGTPYFNCDSCSACVIGERGAVANGTDPLADKGLRRLTVGHMYVWGVAPSALLNILLTLCFTLLTLCWSISDVRWVASCRALCCPTYVILAILLAANHPNPVKVPLHHLCPVKTGSMGLRILANECILNFKY